MLEILLNSYVHKRENKSRRINQLPEGSKTFFLVLTVILGEDFCKLLLAKERHP